jgi:hypothetical protein
MISRRPSFRFLLPAIAGLLLAAPRLEAQGPPPATIVIVNNNAAGVGFNDPTPAAPVGGNTGTTLGQQRLLAFEHAARIWSARISSRVPIEIRAQFTPLAAGVLGSAGPVTVSRDFPGAPLAGTWYHAALANALSGVDRVPGSPDINANFSTNFNFYLGLDGNHGAQPDLVAVLLHEFAHGLGFSQFANLTTGALFVGSPDVYNTHLLDITTGEHWNEMTNAERAASATRFGRVVWDGNAVTAALPSVLVFGSPTVEVNAPSAIAGPLQFGTAAFGAPLGNPNVTGAVVAAADASDAAGPATTDGCSPFTNAAAVAGRIALIERGGCVFALKARNASAAGAAAAIIYNNAANATAAPPTMGGDPAHNAFVTVPTVSLSRPDGLAVLADIANGVTMDIAIDPTIRAGADANGRARVYAPFPISGGSSISHYDTVASRNLLMEPAINGDLTHFVKAPYDLTFEQFTDIGWGFPDADSDGVVDDEDCTVNSDRRPTIVIGGIDTGVPNTLFPSGCTMSDLLSQLKASAANQGAYVSAVAHLTNQWVAGDLLTGAQKGAIQTASTRNR